MQILIPAWITLSRDLYSSLTPVVEMIPLDHLHHSLSTCSTQLSLDPTNVHTCIEHPTFVPRRQSNLIISEFRFPPLHRKTGALAVWLAEINVYRTTNWHASLMKIRKAGTLERLHNFIWTSLLLPPKLCLVSIFMSPEPSSCGALHMQDLYLWYAGHRLVDARHWSMLQVNANAGQRGTRHGCCSCLSRTWKTWCCVIVGSRRKGMTVEHASALFLAIALVAHGELWPKTWDQSGI
jgi:hypothetical protein